MTVIPRTLLDAIANQPEEDAPRLAVAGWLERNGDPQRGEFIRTQCQLAHADVLPMYAQQLRNRESELYHANRERWLADRPRLDGVGWRFLRGLPEHVIFDSYKALHEHRAAVFAHPVTRIGFSNLRSIARVAACPQLAQVRELDLNHCYLRDAGLRDFLGSPYIEQLTWLSLSGNEIGPEGAAALAACPRLNRLEYLELGGSSYRANSIRAEGAQALASSPYFTRLRRLGLSRNEIGDRGLLALAASPHLAGLHTAVVGGNGLTQQAVAAMVEHAAWPNLTHLILNGNRLGDAGMTLLAASGMWRTLRVLEVNSNHLGNDAALALAGARHLDRLVLLDLSGNTIGDEGVIAVAGGEQFRSLSSLKLNYNFVADAGAWALGRSPNLGQLREVQLYGNAVRPDLRAAVEKRFADQDPSQLDKIPQTMLPPVPLDEPPPLERGDGPLDEEALLQAITDDPDDDLARLVYADWFEENGQPDRAELIRVQINDHDPAHRAQHLLQANRERWLGPLAAIVEDLYLDRGLIGVVVSMRTFQSRAFQAEGVGLLKQAGVRALGIRGTTKHWDRVAASPVLAVIRELHLSATSMGEAGIKVLLESPYLAGLHTLSIRGGGLGSRGVTLLAQSAGLPRLRRLDLTDNRISLEGARALIEWPQSARLTRLGLRGNWLHAADISLIATATSLAGLRQIDLSSNWIGDTGARALAAAPQLTSLKALLLDNCNLGSAGVMSLACAVGSTSLTRLSLTGNGITEEGAQAIAESQVLQGLVSLNLIYNPIKDAGLLALLRSPNLHRLRQLSVSRWYFQPDTWQQYTERFGQ